MEVEKEFCRGCGVEIPVGEIFCDSCHARDERKKQDEEGNEGISEFIPDSTKGEIALGSVNAELYAALVDLLAQLEAVGIYIPGQDEGQWADASGLSFRRAEAAVTKCRLSRNE